MAAAIRELSTNRTLALRLAAHGRQTVAEKFSQENVGGWQQELDELKDFLEKQGFKYERPKT